MTNEPGVALTIFSADCTPVLLFDPHSTRHRRGPCGLARHGGGHCGPRGRGHAAGVRLPTGEHPRGHRSCIGPCCFETDADVPDAMRAALGSEAGQAIRPPGKILCRPEAAQCYLAAPRRVTCIDVSADCTACQPQRFWSHRRVGNARGSLAAIIRLREEG